MEIPQYEVDWVLETAKLALSQSDVPKELVDSLFVEVIHPATWEVSLYLPSKGANIRKTRSAIEKALYEGCGVEEMCCDYLGKDETLNAYEWYFRHPHIPKSIYEALEMQIEADLGEEIGMGLPVPSGNKSNSDTAFLVLKEKYFDEIAKGEKTMEYRALNQYYCDKFFSPGVEKKYVKFNRGYKQGDQMVFEIEDICLVSDRWEECPTHDEKGNLIVSFADIPPRFAPCMYGIKLGKRIL